MKCPRSAVDFSRIILESTQDESLAKDAPLNETYQCSNASLWRARQNRAHLNPRVHATLLAGGCCDETTSFLVLRVEKAEHFAVGS